MTLQNFFILSHFIIDSLPFWQHVEKQRSRLQSSVPVEKRERNRNYRRVEKEYLKRKQKHDDARLNATKARNEYLLCMDAANASIQKYFVDDLSDLIDCMDFGFHQVCNFIHTRWKLI